MRCRDLIAPRSSPAIAMLHGRNDRAWRLGRNERTGGLRASFRNVVSGIRRRAIIRATIASATIASSIP